MSQSVPRARVRGVCATSSAHQLITGSGLAGRRASEQQRMRLGGPSAHWSPDVALDPAVLFAHKDISHDSQYNFKKDLKPFFGYTWPKMLKFFEIESIKFVLRVM